MRKNVVCCIYVFCVLGVWGLMPNAVFAQSATWVSEHLQTGIYDAPNQSSRFLGAISAGSAVEVLKTDRQAGYSKIRYGELEGWLLTRHLTQYPPAKEVLIELEKRFEVLEKENVSIKKQNVELNAQLKQTQQHQQHRKQEQQQYQQQLESSLDKQKQLEAENTQLKQEAHQTEQRLKQQAQQLIKAQEAAEHSGAQLTALKRASANVVRIDEQNRRLHETIIQLEQENRRLQHEMGYLKDDIEQKQWIIGGSLVVLGFVLQFVFGLLHRRGRHRQFY